MTHAETHENGHSEEHGSHGGVGKYLAVFVALCVLTGASFLTTSSMWPFSANVSRAFMMAVSCTKAMLVVMFFMHLLWEANWKYVLTIPAAFMSVFLVAMLVPDVGMRLFRYSEERMIHAAKVAPYESHQAASHEAAEHANGEGHGTGHGGSQPDHHAPGDAHDGSTH